MEIAVLEKADQRVVFELHNAGHTFCNNLKKALLQQKDVSVATYSVSHPLVGTPTFIVETTKKADFPKLLLAATQAIKEENKAFVSAFSKLK